MTTGFSDEAGRAASIEPIYDRLFGSTEHNELPEYERKDYFLSADMIARQAQTLIETITGIANVGRAGFVMCRGEGDPPPLEDAERLDQILRAAVYPYPAFSVDRLAIRERLVDVIVIPQSRLRPHFVRERTGSNRFYIPLRGAANNATAARHQVDEMYRETTLEMLRRAFPQVRIGEAAGDETLSYVADIGYGLDPE